MLWASHERLRTELQPSLVPTCGEHPLPPAFADSPDVGVAARLEKAILGII